MFYALAAVLDPAVAEPPEDWAARWLAQARRRLEPGFRRRLAELGTPEEWRRIGRLADPAAADADAVIASLAAHPSVSAAQVEALRRFDRLAFAAFWRQAQAQAQAEGRSPTVFAPGTETSGEASGEAPGKSLGQRARTASEPTAVPRVDPALVFRALGDATRYAVAGLIGRAPMTGADLARRLGVSTPTLTHHLRLLRAAGLVREERAGNSIRLALDRTALAALSGAALAQLCGDGTPPLRRSRRSGARRPTSAASVPARRR